MRTRHELDPEQATNDSACREAALQLLDRSRRPRLDLQRRLRDKGYAAPTIEAVLERLAEVGLVDDVEYARAWLAGRWGRRPSGWRRLQQELRGKGIADEDIERGRALLAERGGAPDESESALRLVSKARARLAGLEPRQQQQKLYALLARRGYDGATIRRVLSLEEPLESGAES